MSIMRTTLALDIELTGADERFTLDASADYSGADVRLRVYHLLVERQGGYMAVKVTGEKYRADGTVGTATTSATLRGKEAQDVFAFLPQALREDIARTGIRVPGINA